jgi:nitroimidazol reductase NimA-like FMN-containing flavoprotein (pyridoxamine 5'-phosphate oxidase superfamily)
MSRAPAIRRADLAMDKAGMRDLLQTGYCGRLATVGEDGWPYCVPLLYVAMDDCVYLHNAAAGGHLRRNLDHEARACFAIDEPGQVYGYGRYECDTSVSYRSVLAFGSVRVVEQDEEKRRFCTALMEKYGGAIEGRPRDFFPRLDHITVYALAIERLTGKQIPLPAAQAQWPQLDRSKSPDAEAPAGAP